MEDSLAAYEAALARVPGPVGRALDLGTGTGAGAQEIRKRFADGTWSAPISAEMLAEARNLAPEITFVQADASDLPFDDESFDLVAHSSTLIPFLDEVARVLRPGGWTIFGFSSGPETPIWVEPKRLRAELEASFTRLCGTCRGPRRGRGCPPRPAPIRLWTREDVRDAVATVGRPFFAVGRLD